jgi:hypothetical protein
MDDIDLAQRLRLCASLFAAVGALSACGGGGGGSSPPPAPPVAAVTGLVPAAPGLGAVLEADASNLVVFRPGATWTYHGVDAQYGPGAPVVRYVDVVTQAQASGGVTEHSTSLFNGGSDDTPQMLSAGVLSTPDSIQVNPNKPADPVSYVELRSPVRVGDQATIYDRHIADSGTDYDGDGKNDAVDIAIWTRVIGTETIDLPNRPGVTAIRVDTTIDQQAYYSASGTKSDVFETVRSIWYAKGLGVVQTRLDTWGPNIAAVHAITTETLDTWDGLTEGVGYRPTTALVVPAGESAGQPVPAPLGVAAFDDHAVLMSFIPGSVQVEGVALTSVDRDGHVLSSTNQHSLAVAGARMTAQKLLRVGNELRLVTLLDDGLSLIGFDAQGQSLTQARTILVANPGWVSDADDEVCQSAAAGDRLWLMWLAGRVDGSGNTIGDLTLQSFDAAGQPASAPVVLVNGINPMAIRSMRISAAGDRMIAGWNVDGIGGNQFYAVADNATGALLATRQLTPPAALGGGSAPAYGAFTPLALGPGLALVFDSDTTPSQLAGVSLDGSFDVLRATSGATLGSEVISPAWMGPVWSWLVTASAGELWLATGGEVQVWPDDAQPTYVTTVSELAPGGGALASAAPALLARAPVQNAAFLVQWSDRVLVIGGPVAMQGATATSTVVWRRPS